MTSVKQSLYETIEELNEEEALQILEFIRRFQRKKRASQTLERLVDDPAFQVPSEVKKGFLPVEPVQGKGIPASQLLVEERR